MMSNISNAYDLEIDTFDISMIVNDDNTYDMTETIDVTFNNSQMHGIYRDIPITTYYKKPIKIKNIQIEGYAYTTETVNGQIRIKIGDPDVYTTSHETYRIHYTYVLGDDLNPDMDELYFNLVGTGWQMPIHNTTFSITMPHPFDSTRLKFSSGFEGYTTSDQVSFKVDGNVISGSCDRMLGPGEALTIALPLPEGYYSEVSPDTFLMDVVGPFVPYLLGVLFLIGIVLWILYGRTEKPIPVIQFYPPQGTTPLEVGYMFDGQVDAYDMTAMLIYWADQGYVRFRELEVETGRVFRHKDITIEIEKIADLPKNVPPYEATYFRELFSLYSFNQKVSIKDLENRFYITLGKVKGQLLKTFRKDPNRQMVMPSSKKIGIVLAVLGWISLFSVCRLVFHQINPYERLGGTIFAAVIPTIALVFGIMGGCSIGLLTSRLPRERVKSILHATVSLILLYGIFSALALYFVSNPILALLSWLGCTLMVLAPLSKKYTPIGLEWMRYLLGLKQFFEQAEKSRIETLVAQDPEYYYHLLPYAMALGVTDAWAKQFETMTLVQPYWYESPYFYGGFSTYVFYDRMNHFTKTVNHSMTSTPSSGGSSSGGSSGGGSGGGGGGGW